MPKLLKKTANDHEAGSSSGRRRLGGTQLAPSVYIRPHSWLGAVHRATSCRGVDTATSSPNYRGATGATCRCTRHSGGGRRATPAATATFPCHMGGI
jgi:hypothetical protein